MHCQIVPCREPHQRETCWQNESKQRVKSQMQYTEKQLEVLEVVTLLSNTATYQPPNSWQSGLWMRWVQVRSSPWSQRANRITHNLSCRKWGNFGIGQASGVPQVVYVFPGQTCAKTSYKLQGTWPSWSRTMFSKNSVEVKNPNETMNGICLQTWSVLSASLLSFYIMFFAFSDFSLAFARPMSVSFTWPLSFKSRFS